MTTSTRSLSTAAVAAAVGILVACQAREPERAQVNPAAATPAVSEKEKPGVSSPTDLAPATAQARIDEIKLGPTVAADGVVSDETHELAAGQTAHLSMAVGDAPAGSAVKVVWFGPNDVRIGDQVETIAAGQRYLTFKNSTQGWAEGQYRVEVFLGDEKVGTEGFDIVKKAA